MKFDSHRKALRARVRLLLVEKWLMVGLGCGMIVAAVFALLSGKYDALLDYRLWAAVVGSGAVVGTLYAIVRPLSDASIAVAADRRAGLKERVSTALSARSPSSADEFTTALISDAENTLSSTKPSEVFRRRIGFQHWLFGAAALLLALAILLPVIPGLNSPERRREAQVMKQEGKNLTRAARDIRKQAGPSREDIRKLADRMQKLGEKMETGRLNRKTALVKTRKLSDELAREQQKLAEANSGTRSMREAEARMRESTDELARRTAAEIAKRENIPPEDALKKVPSDELLKRLANKSGPLNESERKQLAEALEKYADPNSSLPIPSELGEALAKLAANSDFQAAAELMRKLSQKMGSGNMSKVDRETLKKQMEALAEALKNTDLDELAKMMRENAEKLAKMSPEELKRMMEQMEKAQQMALALQSACGTCKGTGGALVQCGIGASGAGPGGGFGADNRNTGPRGKLQPTDKIEKVPTQVGQSGMVFSAGETMGAPDASSPASVPYSEVLPDYRKTAEEALAKEKVPPAYRTRVKDYFSSLE